jgi:hypothetical protein
MGGALPYSELDVTALLDSHGERLYLYFWLMLGDELSATRALTDTIIGVLPDPDHRELFTVARRVCRQYQPVPAALSAGAGVATLAALTIVALRRLDPDDREICVLGAPRYHLDDADLAAVLGTWTVDALRPRGGGCIRLRTRGVRRRGRVRAGRQPRGTGAAAAWQRRCRGAL